VELVVDVDRHRGVVGQRGKRMRQRSLPAQRRHRQGHAGGSRDEAGPGSRGVDHAAGRHLPALGPHAPNPPRVLGRLPVDETRHLAHAVFDAHPQPLRGGEVPLHDLERHDVAVDRTVRAADETVHAHRRRQAPDLVRVDLARLADAGGALHAEGLAQRAELRRRLRHEQVPDRPVPRVRADLVAKPKQLLAREQ
jgi:hypothetical protein